MAEQYDIFISTNFFKIEQPLRCNVRTLSIMLEVQPLKFILKSRTLSPIINPFIQCISNI